MPDPWGGPIQPRPFVGPPAPPRPSQTGVGTDAAVVKPLVPVTVSPVATINRPPVTVGRPPIVAGSGYIKPGWYQLPSGDVIYVNPPWDSPLPLPPKPPVIPPFPGPLTKPGLVNAPVGTPGYPSPEMMIEAGGGGGPIAQEMLPGGGILTPGGPDYYNPGTIDTVRPVRPVSPRPAIGVWVGGVFYVLVWVGNAWFWIQMSADAGDYVGQQIGTKPTPPGSQGVPTWQGVRPSDLIPSGNGIWIGMPMRPQPQSSFFPPRPLGPDLPPVWIPPNSQYPGSPGFWYFPPAGSVPAGSGLGDDPADGQDALMRPFSGSLGIATAQ